MPKGTKDIILRDRLQYTVGAGSENSLVYGRINLDDYVNIGDKKGLKLKQVNIQLRDPNNAGTVDVDETGVWFPGPATAAFAVDVSTVAGGAVKACVSTIAYSNMAEIGIASPGVYHIEEWAWLAYSTDQTSNPAAPSADHILQNQHRIYNVDHLHPGGATIVSDLLIGIAADSQALYQADDVLEVDVMLICEPVNITQKALTQLLTQAQDN